ncbi:DUF3221 domain-containing protein [Bacillus cereus]|uniref:DUF3221 domain-containing protein n=1 Tax=Bacillus TaxID=1386 RepID=UPI0005578B42|nr:MULTISPECIES: DUF3221 domain-containing protein [unclassified Bacillus (in: firmicutes)]
MKNSINFVGIIIVFLIIFMIVLTWKIDTNSELTRSTMKTSNSAVSKGIDGYILLKGDTVYFIEEKHIKDAYDRKHLEERLKRKIPADAILHFNNASIEKGLQTGDKVEIWYSEILESYPAKIQVTKIEKIQD